MILFGELDHEQLIVHKLGIEKGVQIGGQYVQLSVSILYGHNDGDLISWPTVSGTVFAARLNP